MSTSPRKRPASEALVAGGVVVLLIAIVALVFWSGAGSALYPPDAVTEEGQLISNLYDIIFAIAVAIFVAVEGLIVWSIVRYRRRPGDVDLPPQTHGNNLVEVLWTVIPTVIVIYMFAISWQTLNSVEEVSARPDVHVHVLAGQFQWQFEYLDANEQHIATQTKAAGQGGGMAVPVGKNVYVTLESQDVIHAWYVPRFLFKRDVVPGQINHFEFKVDPAEAGQTFHGQCAELCGTGHRVMLFDVNAMSDADFQAFLDRLVATENATPPPAPSGAPVVDVSAKNFIFDKKTIDVAADQPFVINFTNEDIPAVTHDIDIRESDGTTVVEDQEVVPGGKTMQYQYKPLAAGTYTFICSVHPTIPTMSGTLTVK
jgi:cytochrome c oxidase subunit II